MQSRVRPAADSRNASAKRNDTASSGGINSLAQSKGPNSLTQSKGPNNPAQSKGSKSPAKNIEATKPVVPALKSPLGIIGRKEIVAGKTSPASKSPTSTAPQPGTGNKPAEKSDQITPKPKEQQNAKPVSPSNKINEKPPVLTQPIVKLPSESQFEEHDFIEPSSRNSSLDRPPPRREPEADELSPRQPIVPSINQKSSSPTNNKARPNANDLMEGAIEDAKVKRRPTIKGEVVYGSSRDRSPPGFNNKTPLTETKRPPASFAPITGLSNKQATKDADKTKSDKKKSIMPELGGLDDELDLDWAKGIMDNDSPDAGGKRAAATKQITSTNKNQSKSPAKVGVEPYDDLRELEDLEDFGYGPEENQINRPNVPSSDADNRNRNNSPGNKYQGSEIKDKFSQPGLTANSKTSPKASKEEGIYKHAMPGESPSFAGESKDSPSFRHQPSLAPQDNMMLPPGVLNFKPSKPSSSPASKNIKPKAGDDKGDNTRRSNKGEPEWPFGPSPKSSQGGPSQTNTNESKPNVLQGKRLHVPSDEEDGLPKHVVEIADRMRNQFKTPSDKPKSPVNNPSESGQQQPSNKDGGKLLGTLNYDLPPREDKPNDKQRNTANFYQSPSPIPDSNSDRNIQPPSAHSADQGYPSFGPSPIHKGKPISPTQQQRAGELNSAKKQASRVPQTAGPPENEEDELAAFFKGQDSPKNPSKTQGPEDNARGVTPKDTTSRKQTPTQAPGRTEIIQDFPSDKQTPTQPPGRNEASRDSPSRKQTPTQASGRKEAAQDLPNGKQTPTQASARNETSKDSPSRKQTPTQAPDRNEAIKDSPSRKQTPNQAPGHVEATQDSLGRKQTPTQALARNEASRDSPSRKQTPTQAPARNEASRDSPSRKHPLATP